MNEPQRAGGAGKLFAAHPRAFHENRYVYPVVSRRSGGVSIGVNLSRGRESRGTGVEEGHAQSTLL